MRLVIRVNTSRRWEELRSRRKEDDMIEERAKITYLSRATHHANPFLSSLFGNKRSSSTTGASNYIANRTQHKLSPCMRNRQIKRMQHDVTLNF